MSMNTLTMIQIAEVFAVYTLITLLLPWIALRKVFRKFTIPEQIMGYFLAGNIYVIYLVFLMEFLHISGRVSLIIGSVVPFVVILYKKGFLKKLVGIRYLTNVPAKYNDVRASVQRAGTHDRRGYGAFPGRPVLYRKSSKGII